MTTADPGFASKPLTKLALGSCPDSWGVWFANDKLQTPWSRFLDELSDVGYEWLELGPYGYLPTDPNQLRDELSRRGLKVSGGTVDGHSGLHRPADFPSILERTRNVAALTSAMDAKHVIFVPTPGYRDDTTGAYTEPAELSSEEWKTFIDATNRLGRIISEEYGVRLQFHPHADSHVETQEQTERFLNDTDPDFVSLCLDTGHLAYRHADVASIIRKFPERIGYVHLKQMDPDVLSVVTREDLAFGQAVKQGVSCEAPNGVPAIPPIVDELQKLDADLFLIVEQDMYPCSFDAPKPAAERTNKYLQSIGIGKAAR
jgi:inosose dehydratase